MNSERFQNLLIVTSSAVNDEFQEYISRYMPDWMPNDSNEFNRIIIVESLQKHEDHKAIYEIDFYINIASCELVWGDFDETDIDKIITYLNYIIENSSLNKRLLNTIGFKMYMYTDPAQRIKLNMESLSIESHSILGNSFKQFNHPFQEWVCNLYPTATPTTPTTTTTTTPFKSTSGRFSFGKSTENVATTTATTTSTTTSNPFNFGINKGTVATSTTTTTRPPGVDWTGKEKETVKPKEEPKKYGGFSYTNKSSDTNERKSIYGNTFNKNYSRATSFSNNSKSGGGSAFSGSAFSNNGRGRGGRGKIQYSPWNK